MTRYRETMTEAGYDEAAIARNVADTWVWRNVCVAKTDAEAERLALPAFEAMIEFRQAMRMRIYREQGVRLKQDQAGPARAQAAHALLCGSPETVRNALAEIDDIGVGGLIVQFRIGPLSHEATERSVRPVS